MKHLLLLLIIFISNLITAQTPNRGWHYGSEISTVWSRQFDWQIPILDNTGSVFRIQTWGEYRFKAKARGPFTIQNGLRFDVQSFLRDVLIWPRQYETGFFRIPFTWTMHQPRYLRDEKHPLFEMSTAIGPHITLPFAGDTDFIPPQPFAPSLGIYTALGIEFYIQTGSRLTLNFQASTDFIPLEGSGGSRYSPLFFDSGFSIGFASSFADTRIRAKAMKEYRKKKKKRR
jgi:hypothetical protein